MKRRWGGGAESHTRARGRQAEAAAADWLERQGYRMLGRNVTTPAGEIDLIAMDGACLCFIEVKARSGPRFGPALAAVDRRKQRRLTRAAALYLSRCDAVPECRFDVLGIDLGAEGWEVSLVRDAFPATY